VEGIEIAGECGSFFLFALFLLEVSVAVGVFTAGSGYEYLGVLPLWAADVRSSRVVI
jgi:hypothetical protein